MRTSKSIVLLASIVLACAAVQQLDSKPHSRHADKVADFGFGLHIAGSYFGEFVVQLPNEPPEPAVLALNTITADGTFIVTGADIYGNGDPDPETPGLRSVTHGSWVRTGKRTTTWNSLILAFDKTGMLGDPAFAEATILRMSGVTEFSKDYRSITGNGTIEVFWPDLGLDPLDLDVKSPVSFPMSLTFERIDAR